MPGPGVEVRRRLLPNVWIMVWMCGICGMSLGKAACCFVSSVFSSQGRSGFIVWLLAHKRSETPGCLFLCHPHYLPFLPSLGNCVIFPPLVARLFFFLHSLVSLNYQSVLHAMTGLLEHFLVLRTLQFTFSWKQEHTTVWYLVLRYWIHVSPFPSERVELNWFSFWVHYKIDCLLTTFFFMGLRRFITYPLMRLFTCKVRVHCLQISLIHPLLEIHHIRYQQTFTLTPLDGQDDPYNSNLESTLNRWTSIPLSLQTRSLPFKMKTGFFALAVTLLLPLVASQPHRKDVLVLAEPRALAELICRSWTQTWRPSNQGGDRYIVYHRRCRGRYCVCRWTWQASHYKDYPA